MRCIFSFKLNDVLTSILLVCTSLFFTINCSAANTREGVEEVFYLKDSSYSINNLPKNKFHLLQHPKFGINNGTYWFKIYLNQSLVNQEVVLNVKESTVGLIEVYDHNGFLTNSRENQLGNWTSALKLIPKSPILYLRVDFPTHLNFPLKVYTEKEFRKKESSASFSKGFYYGYIFMVFILNLFFLIRFREKSFLYYCVFLFLTNIGIAIYDGILFNNTDSINAHYISIIFRILIPFAGALFATHFLRLKIYSPKSKKVALLLFVITVLLYSLNVITNELIFYALGDVTALLILSYYWLLGIVVYRKYEFAKFFVVGYSFILLSGIFFIIPLGFGINYIDLSLNHVKIGSLLETLILTYAISYRIKILQEDNELYRMQISSYLSKIDYLKQENKDVIKENPELQKIKISEIANENQLTDREEEVLSCLSKNMTNQEIATVLFVSVNTIKFHTRNIYQKLDLSNKKEVLTLFNEK